MLIWSKHSPVLNDIKNLQTTLMLMTKTLAVYQIGHAHVLRQLHTDETTCQQTLLLNVVILYLTHDDNFKTICVNG